MPEYTIRPATAADIDQVYRIRYDSYLTANLIPPCQSKELQDIHDISGLSTTFVLTEGRDIIGTSRVVPDSPFGLPMDDAGFAPALDKYRDKNKRIIEGGRFAILPQYQHVSRYLSLHLALYTIAYSVVSNFDEMFIVVAEHHRKFYELVLMFETIVSNYKTKYSLSSCALRLRLKGLLSRYKKSRLAQRFDLPLHLDNYQLSHIQDRPEVVILNTAML